MGDVVDVTILDVTDVCVTLNIWRIVTYSKMRRGYENCNQELH